MVDKTNPAEAHEQTDPPGAPVAPGVTPDVREVVEGPAVAAVTSAQATHSTGQDPDGGQPAADVAKAIAEGVPPEPVPAAGTVLYATPGGYQVVPAGVEPEQVGSNAVGR